MTRGYYAVCSAASGPCHLDSRLGRKWRPPCQGLSASAARGQGNTMPSCPPPKAAAWQANETPVTAERPLFREEGPGQGKVSVPKMDRSFSGTLAADLAAALFHDGDHGWTRRHAVSEVRPARRRIVEVGLVLFARMLDRHEQCLSVGREDRAAQFRTTRTAEEVPRDCAPVAIQVSRPDAIMDAEIGETVGSDPDPPLRVERDIVRTREPAALAHFAAVLGALRRVLRIACLNEDVPSELGRRMVGLAVLGRWRQLDDVAPLVLRPRVH